MRSMPWSVFGRAVLALFRIGLEIPRRIGQDRFERLALVDQVVEVLDGAAGRYPVLVGFSFGGFHSGLADRNNVRTLDIWVNRTLRHLGGKSGVVELGELIHRAP
jgi:hypothetical protein